MRAILQGVTNFAILKNFRRFPARRADIIFLGDYASIEKDIDGTFRNKFYGNIITQLGYISVLDIYFPTSEFLPLKKLGSKRIPFEKFIQFKDFLKPKHHKAFPPFARRFELSNLEKRQMGILYKAGVRMIKQLQPKIIVLTCYNSSKYPIIVAAKDMEVKTIELQHGNMHETHKAYFFKKHIENYVFPDEIITYGKFESRVLQKKSIYKKEQIKVLGCPRYDFLRNLRIDRKDVLQKNKIPNKKILFWPTQTHDRIMTRNGENELNAEAIFKGIKDKQDWFLLIKLHPNEDQDKGIKFYKEKARENGVKNYKILRAEEENTYNCISISKAVVLKHSTVGMESILMDVPIINLEIIESWSLKQFKELKSSLIVKKTGDVSKIIKKLETNKYKKIFSEARKKYIKEHFNNFGSATERIANYLMSHI